MADPDFDISRLATYLHLTPAQVGRLADRGKLPGRKVGGAWRFSPAEIHHWLEQRIGLSDGEELAQMETVLGRNVPPDQPQEISVAELLHPDAVAVPLAARTRGKVITAMVQLAAGTGLLWDPEKMADAVRTREDMQSTALDSGVALLHPRRPMPGILGQALLAVGCTSQPIPFGGGRSGMTDVFFLICSVDDQGHLRALARLSRLLSDGALLDLIRQAESSANAFDLIVRHEQQLLGPQG